jgi:hypothetical protein
MANLVQTYQLPPTVDILPPPNGLNVLGSIIVLGGRVLSNVIILANTHVSEMHA